MRLCFLLLKTTCKKGGAELKKKELMKRLSAISMAAMMTVTMIPSNAYAADELFSDVEVETTADAGDEDSADAEISDADDTSDADIEMEDAEDGSADANVEADEEEDLGEVDVFSDGSDSAGETDVFDAGDGTPAADAVVHMTVSVAGNFAKDKDSKAMIQRDVTVKDLDSNGVLTYDEALIAAHNEYYDGGAAAGYATENSDYGLKITKLWGDGSGAYSYCLNDVFCNGLSDTVKADDYLTAYSFKDAENYSDAYTKFNQKEYKVSTGSQMTASVKKASFDEAGKLVYTDCDGAVLSAYDSDLQPLGADAYTVDGYKVTFHKAGTYYLTATGTDNMNLVPAAAKVTVADWKSPFANIRFYRSQMDYENGAEPIVYTPAYNGDIHQYAVTVPDYISKLFAAVNYSDEIVASGKHSMVMYTTSWGKWGSGSPVAGDKSTNVGDAYFTKGYAGVYYDNGLEDARDKAYLFNVKQSTTLSGLTIDGIVDQKFDRDNFTYHVYISDEKNSVSITPTAYKSNYIITVNGTEVTSGQSCDLICNWNENGEMEVPVVVSKDGMISTTYTVNLEKMPKKDKPVIVKQPAKQADYIVNEKTEGISFLASANGELAYQWYMNTTDSNEGGTPIEGATDATYKPTSDKVGTFYYYCVVTNTGKTENNKTSTETACVVVDFDPTPVATITTVGNELPDDYPYAWKTGYIYNVGDEATPR